MAREVWMVQAMVIVKLSEHDRNKGILADSRAKVRIWAADELGWKNVKFADTKAVRDGLATFVIEEANR